MASLAGIGNFYKLPDLRRRVFFTLGMLAVYRIGCFVTLPGVDRNQMKQYVAGSGGLLGFFNLFSGGALENLSIFDPVSPPAESIRLLFFLVLAITALIFLVVEGVLLYSIVRFRARPGDRTSRSSRAVASHHAHRSRAWPTTSAERAAA